MLSHARRLVPSSRNRSNQAMFSSSLSQRPPIIIIKSIVLALLWALGVLLQAQTAQPAARVFQNVRIFDGKTEISHLVGLASSIG